MTAVHPKRITSAAAENGGGDLPAAQQRRRRLRPFGGGAAAARAFTLVELLVVIALSALLLALLFGPLVQGFRLTNRARAEGAAQDATRFGIEQLSRELRQASYVFDNTNISIILPLEAPSGGTAVVQSAANVTRKNTYATDKNGNAIVLPFEDYGRIDFIGPDVRTDTAGGYTSSSNPTDPTTGKPLYGGQLRLTTAPGKIYTRYWIGLRRNYTATNGSLAKTYYSNVYEFPRTDSEMNTFILYRADYDPTDPNLIAQVTDPNTNQKIPKMARASSDTAYDYGAFDDPDFFYNLKPANTTNAAGVAGNGKSYAENWRAIATPVIASPNLDLLQWRRDSHRQIITSSPYLSGITFTPGGIVGDTATPGFSSAPQAEDPTAVPSLYTTQYGQWTMPFSVTIYRASTQYASGIASNDPRYGLWGNITLLFHADTNGNVQVDVAKDSTGNYEMNGSLALTTSDEYFWMQSASSGRYFVKLPNVSFTVDPSRGLIDSGLPPLASEPLTTDSNGQPMFYNYSSTAGTLGAILGMAPSKLGSSQMNYGELVEMNFTESTLHRLAGQTAGTQSVPLNQGIFYADLASLGTNTVVGPNGMLDRGNYYALTDTNHTTPYISPFVTFGGAVSDTTTLTNYRGARIVPGSEKVTGPPNQVFEVSGSGSSATDPNLAPSTVTSSTTVTGDVLYTRVPEAVTSLTRDASIITSPETGGQGIYVRRSPLTYWLVQNRGSYNKPYLQFDDAAGNLEDPRNQDPALTAASLLAFNTVPAGLPAGFSSDTSSATHDRKITVTYLWQNNYARTADGHPADPSGATELSRPANAIRPEPDVIKADYGTRALISVGLNVHVYDTSSGQPQGSQVTDRIRVSNVAR